MVLSCGVVFLVAPLVIARDMRALMRQARGRLLSKSVAELQELARTIGLAEIDIEEASAMSSSSSSRESSAWPAALSGRH